MSGSAHAAQRLLFKELINKIRRKDALVAAKLDRLGRDAPDVLATIKLLAERKVEVCSSSASSTSVRRRQADAGDAGRLLVERTQAGLAAPGRKRKRSASAQNVTGAANGDDRGTWARRKRQRLGAALRHIPGDRADCREAQGAEMTTY